jgi:hypothetical protein
MKKNNIRIFSDCPVSASKIVSCVFSNENGKYLTVIKYIGFPGEEITYTCTTDSRASFNEDIQFFTKKGIL